MTDNLPPAPKEEFDKDAGAASTARLLLHAVDGVIPFLTPNLCRRCFPPDQVSDILSIGIAARDTCLVPIFTDEKRKKKKSTAAVPKKDQEECATSKPRGYVFSDTAKLDHFVLPYNRVTVPTFDLYQDAACFGGTNKKGVVDVFSLGDLPSASSHVHLWTANGRHQITPEQYAACATSLNSAMTIPLFDTIRPTSGNSTGDSEEDVLLQKRRAKRMHHANQHNQGWTTAMMGGSTSKMLLTPLAVASDVDLSSEDLGWISQQVITENDVKGIALVGYQHIQTPERRMHVLESLDGSSWLSSSAIVATLSTTSIIQLVELLKFSVRTGCRVMVGTNLPSVWAQSKKAFVLDIETCLNADSSSLKSNSKRQKVMKGETLWVLDEDNCFDLNPKDNANDDEHPWFRDKQALVPGCSCMACSTYSRSYLYHLVCSKELLAELLLFIHNLHHLLGLLRAFNRLKSSTSTKDGAASFCDNLQAQLQNSIVKTKSD